MKKELYTFGTLSLVVVADSTTAINRKKKCLNQRQFVWFTQAISCSFKTQRFRRDFFI